MRAYTIVYQNVASLAYGTCNCRLRLILYINKFYSYKKSSLKKNTSASHQDVSVSCAIQEYDNLKTPYHPLT